jgi:hypothetical protein
MTGSRRTGEKGGRKGKHVREKRSSRLQQSYTNAYHNVRDDFVSGRGPA